ncbi:MAG TPA: SDR family NAD(P)-dependent oxidoreductase [Candidatus Melainabacteria bacterium]|nr:SDR family NAD(P)-dependent oxidoreductase [Candidatus Melainabacteria bacterium]
MDRKLYGMTIVITGASSGFGKGCALEFAKLGASLVLAARNEEALRELVVECARLGGSAVSVPTDVADPNEVASLYQQSLDCFGKIDVWINNAGAAAIGVFSEVPLADHLKVIDVDLAGTMCGSYFAMQHFMQKGQGTLINVASMIGKIPAPYYASYSAAKHAVVGLSAALRQEIQELKKDRIHVCTVLPMAMDTPFFEHAANYTGRKSVPIPPLSDAQDVIDAIVDLVFKPKPEVAVGKAAGIFSASDALLPGATEAMMAKTTQKAQIEEAPAAPFTKGNLEQPSNRGTGVHSDYKKEAS